MMGKIEGSNAGETRRRSKSPGAAKKHTGLIQHPTAPATPYHPRKRISDHYHNSPTRSQAKHTTSSMLRLSFERSARPCRGSLRGGWLRQHCRLTAAGAPSRALRGRSGTHSHQQSGARYPAQNWRIAPTRAGFTQRPLYPLLPRCAVPATAGAPSLELRALAGLATPPSSSGARAVRPLAAAGGSPGLAAAHPRSHPGANCRGGNTPARGMPSARGSKLPLPGLSERSAPPLTRLRFAFTQAASPLP